MPKSHLLVGLLTFGRVQFEFAPLGQVLEFLMPRGRWIQLDYGYRKSGHHEEVRGELQPLFEHLRLDPHRSISDDVLLGAS